MPLEPITHGMTAKATEKSGSLPREWVIYYEKILTPIIDDIEEGKLTVPGTAEDNFPSFTETGGLQDSGLGISEPCFDFIAADVTYLQALVADITQTDLVDKSATEAINGAWSFAGSLTMDSNLHISDNKRLIFGNDTNGSWSISVIGGKLVTENKQSNTWVKESARRVPV